MFYPTSLRERARANIAKYDWAKNIEQQIIEAARPWREMSDDQLWSLMFGATIPRSWMVWSNGFCPACKQSVPMYNWKIDAIQRPWKVQCPHCAEFFPKNDFQKFHNSGLDAHGVFDPKLADRSLLFNAEHPDPQDPRHKFGVDDGTGYVEGENRWRFIGAYLIYGQWKQAVLGGIKQLAAAYVVTGDPVYARKAGILLDRVADLYPTFDYKEQAVVYERKLGSNGYVSVWHDACEETRELALGYDAVRDGFDESLVKFLAQKSKQHKLENPKQNLADIHRNITERILLDAVQNEHKIRSNYPRTPICIAILKSVASWEKYRDDVMALLDATVAKATAVDGVTGEKGLAGYCSFTISGLANGLALYARVQPDFLRDLLQRHPKLRQTYRFHIDTWVMQQYYPQAGDSGAFAKKESHYVGVNFARGDALALKSIWTFLLSPSMFQFFWQLYQQTGDVDYVRVLYHANEGMVDDLPHDLFAENPEAFQKQVREIIERSGAAIPQRSVNKQEWRIAILRSGKAADERALWIDYDAGGAHGHSDAMNIGLFAKGLDLMPDFGYPPVQFGGWDSPRARWYTMMAAHNTVVVDGLQRTHGEGNTTLWADGNIFRAIRVSAPEGGQYERTVMLIDVDERDSYVLDIFRVSGGKDHAKFFHSHFGTVTTRGLTLKPAPDYGHETQMRNFQTDAAPRPGWHADWHIEDRYRYLPPDKKVRLRYTDLTNHAEASVCEGWVVAGMFSETEEVWIPRLMVRRQSKQPPLTSTFVSVMEPYETEPCLTEIRRYTLQTADGTACPEPNVLVELKHRDGKRDVILALDVENPLKDAKSVVQKELEFETDAEIAFVRVGANGQVEYLALSNGSWLRLQDAEVRFPDKLGFTELAGSDLRKRK